VRLLAFRVRGGEVRAPLAAVKHSTVNLGFDQANRDQRESLASGDDRHRTAIDP